MKYFRFYAAAIALTLAASCGKKDTSDDPGNGWTTGVSTVYHPQSLQPGIQSWTFPAGSAHTIQSIGGIRIEFPGNAFRTAAGTPIAGGDVTVHLSEYFTNADLVYSRIGTVSTGDSLLQTGGAFHLAATQGGVPVYLDDPALVSVPDKERFNSSHRIFSARAEGAETANRVPWEAGRRGWERTRDAAGNGAYSFVIDSLQWWNMDHYPNPGNGYSPLTVKMPEGYGSLNTSVILLLDDRGASMLSGNASEKQFVSARAPVGMAMKVLAIASREGRLQYHLHSFTLTAGQVYTVPGFTSVTQEELHTIIRNNL